MRWSNVWVIFGRETRDQLRDRRTLFMVLGLPILLYPILMISMVSLVSAFEQKPRTVVIVGAEYLPAEPPILNDEKNGFRVELFDPPTEDEASRLKVRLERDDAPWSNQEFRESALRGGLADAVVVVPKDIRKQLTGSESSRFPVEYNSAEDQSQICAMRVRDVLASWRESLVNQRLKLDNKPASYVTPIKVEQTDVARKDESGGNVWARLFPFLLVMMALTGAFYPAIDLCAGEKERGTMETLLISPASREEIVLGKFFTVMLASIVTALLNLLSMGLTGWQLAQNFGGLRPAGPSGHRFETALSSPSLTSALWIVVLLIPLSALFSSLCLALAVLARSMKEGQYYMTPLYLVALPLIIITLMPGIELNLFTSLVPITGASLLLKALMQGKYALAGQFILPVLVPTILYAVLALRWAVEQFRSESVLFREAERFSLGDWIRHMIRDREPRPNAGMAVLCFAVMLATAGYSAMLLGTSLTSLVLSQTAMILGPPVVLAFLLTSDPLGTLRLRMPRASDLALAAGLALAVHPFTVELSPYVQKLFPVPKIVQEALAKLVTNVSLPTALVCFALVPAICEEVAFRGFILSGLERGGRQRSAILLSAFLFGFLHVLLSVFQQFFNATILGLLLGLLAIRSRSLWPCILFHAINNGLAVSIQELIESPRFAPFLAWIYRDTKPVLYQPPVLMLSGACLALFLWILMRGREKETSP